MTSISNCLLLCLFGILAYLAPNTAADEAIIRGTLVRRVDQFSYVVSVQDYDEFHLCGGGIISDHHVLTVARCTMNVNGVYNHSPLFIVAGTNSMYEDEPPAVRIKVRTIFLPKEYVDPISTPCDIAVLLLAQSLELSQRKNVRSLKLPRHDERQSSYDHKTAMLAGFGSNWYDYTRRRGGSDGQLRFAEVIVLKKGDEAYHSHTDQVKQICAQVKQHPAKSAQPRGACSGDAGNPLVCNDTVIGILSVSSNHPTVCSEKLYGAIYTNIFHYRTFIENSMNYDKENKDHKDIRILEPLH